MKNNIISMLSFFVYLSSFSQEIKKEITKDKTKMDALVSKTGTTVKITDINLSGMNALYTGLSETRVRKITNANLINYFFQIVKKGEYSNSTASIEYNDISEIIKVIQILKKDIDKDISLLPDYLENKFTTLEGFQIGYFISKGEVTWLIKLDKNDSDNSLYFKGSEIIEIAFNEAKNKMEELKQQLNK
jgi:hypothetical protein